MGILITKIMTDVEVELNEPASEGARLQPTNKISIKEWFVNKLHRLRCGRDEPEIKDEIDAITETTSTVALESTNLP